MGLGLGTAPTAELRYLIHTELIPVGVAAVGVLGADTALDGGVRATRRTVDHTAVVGRTAERIRDAVGVGAVHIPVPVVVHTIDAVLGHRAHPAAQGVHFVDTDLIPLGVTAPTTRPRLLLHMETPPRNRSFAAPVYQGSPTPVLNRSGGTRLRGLNDTEISSMIPFMVMARRISLLAGVLVLVQGGPAAAAPPPDTGEGGGRILHRPVNTVLTGRTIYLRARLQEDFVDLAQLRLYYRWGDAGPFLRKTMNGDGSNAFVGCVPGKSAATGLQYYLEAVDIRGRRQAGYGTRRRPVVVRASLAPSAPFARAAQRCPDGAGQQVTSARPTHAQLRQVRLRKRTLALEARSLRLRNAGRTLVYGSLVALAVGGGFVASGLSQGPVFLWVGVAISGVAVLMAVLGAPLWAIGSKQLRRAQNQLTKPQTALPPEHQRQLRRLWTGPGRTARGHTVLTWRLRF